MDKELKAKWVEALRSGKYQQTQGDLRDRIGYCCLGVLLDVSKRGEWDESEYYVGDGEDRCAISGELEGHAASFGLTTEQESTLIRMNDGKKAWEGNPQSFSQIADYIERHL